MRQVTLILFVVIGFGLTSIQAQPTLRADKTEALIGDKINLQLVAPGMTEDQWINKDVIPADTVNAIHLLETFPIEAAAGNAGISRSWTVAVYDTGIVRIPQIPVITNRGGSIDTFYTNDIPIVVSGVIDSLGAAPIKPIVYEPARFSDYLPYILGLVGIVLLAIGAWYYSNRPKKEREIIEIVEVKPPDEIALEALNELENEKLWQKGLIKDYHSKLSHILRAYLEARYAISALELTTGELKDKLEPQLNSEQYKQMMQMMHLEDLIKFAKASPPDNVHAEYLEFVRQFVISTRQELKEVEDA